MARTEIITLGCRLNIYESEKMHQLAQMHGVEDVVIINSCAVTQRAERQSRQAIRRARRDHPARRILATGCAAEIAPQQFAAMTELDGIIKNAEKIEPKIFSALSKRKNPKRTNIIQDFSRDFSGITARQSRTRAMLKVQDGCNWRCTFCTIPQGRGPSRSRPAAEIIHEANALFAAGHQEITLTGVDITSYGHDFGDDFPQKISLGALVERILAATPSELKLRLTSLDPAAIDPALFALLAAHPRLLPHIHLSVQAGDNMILKRMRRRHSREQVIELCEGLRKNREISFGADLIAGFPTETPSMFARTAELIDICDIVFAHIFPFSPRRGTAAARMPPVMPKIATQRAEKLRGAAQQRFTAFLNRQIGSTIAVLAETPHTGRAANYAPVRWREQRQAGQTHMMKICDHTENALIAKPAAAPDGSAPDQ